MEQSSLHKQHLSKLCRVCGQKVISKVGYKTPVNVSKYQEEFGNLYGIKVLDEDDDVFPKILCAPCSKKLYRARKSNIFPTEFSKSTLFSPHNELQCDVCDKWKSQKTENYSLTKLDLNMSGAGFQKIFSESYRRVFIRQKFNSLRGRVTTEITICIHFDNTWLCYIFGRPVDIEAVLKLPRTVNNEMMFAEFFKDNILCPGLNDYTDVFMGHGLAF